jgi:hypothetical protein
MSIRHPLAGAFAAGAITFVACALIGHLHPTVYNNYVLLADAMRHGHLWIDWPGPYIDAVLWEGRRYSIEAPMPSLAMLPAVLIWGTAVNQTVFAVFFCAVAIGAAWEVLRRLEVPVVTRAWLCGFLLFGTDLLWCAVLGDVWFIAHVFSVAFTLLALAELLGAKRPWLVALWAFAAMESRFALVMAIPVYGALLYLDAPPLERRRRIATYAATLLPCALLWIGYNEARWGMPNDIGYTLFYRQDSMGSPFGSPFALANLPTQLYSFFVRFPDIVRHAPYLIPTYNGVALTWTSPALFLALFARSPHRLVVAMWIATVLVAVPSFIYYTWGFAQFGMRHALDFEPFLFVLVGLAMRRGIGPIGAILCSWSMLAGAWGIWYWKAFYRPL